MNIIGLLFFLFFHRKIYFKKYQKINGKNQFDTYIIDLVIQENLFDNLQQFFPQKTITDKSIKNFLYTTMHFITKHKTVK